MDQIEDGWIFLIRVEKETFLSFSILNEKKTKKKPKKQDCLKNEKWAKTCPSIPHKSMIKTKSI